MDSFPWYIIPSYHLEMTFFVGKHGVCEGCNEGGLPVVAAVAQAQEGGEDTRDDEDGEEDDEGGGEGRR